MRSAGSLVVLQAIPAPGSIFSGWLGPRDCLDGVVTLTDRVECTAVFGSPTGAPEVETFDYIELSLFSGQSYSNPFTDVDLTVLVTAPEGVATVRGFFDGDGSGGQEGGVWKFRYMPSRAGAHSFITVSNDGDLNAVSGSFSAIGSARRGPVGVSPHEPHLTSYRTGNAFVPVGETAFFMLSDDWSQGSRLQFVSEVAEKGANKIIMVMVNDDTNDVLPWLGSASSPDWTRFDLSRLREWEGVIDRMREAGVIAYLWFYSDDSARMYPPANSATEDLYFSYIIARFSAFENVVWNLALEYSEYRSGEWVQNRAAFVKQEDPYDHLLAVHQVPGQTFDFPGDPHLDIYSHQGELSSAADASSLILDNQARSVAAGRPIVVWPEEWTFDPPGTDYEQTREIMWAISLQGGGHSIMARNFWGAPGTVHWWNDLQGALSSLMMRVEYYEAMRVRNELVSGGGSTRFCMTNDGIEYLILALDSEPFDLDLSDSENRLAVEWWDPDSGAVETEGEVEGGSVRSFTPPGAPMILYLSAVLIFSDGFETGDSTAWLS